jgi:phosphatidyl-myo-inositol dimannoside synthase
MTASRQRTVTIGPAPASRRAPVAVLGTVTQERGHGGIARVSALLWRAMEELAGSRRRVITLLKDSPHPRPADKLRFAWEVAGLQWRGQAQWILFDHLGVAAVENLVPRSRRAPYAVFLHGVEVWCPLSPRQEELLRSAAIRISNSHYTAERAAKTHPGVGPIAVCHLALLDEERSAWHVPASETPDLDMAARVGGHAVLIVGRMSSSERYKGHDQLIEAWPLVRSAVPDAQLIIVGTGDDAPRLKARAAETGAGEEILFTGRVSDATLDMLYARAAVFAMPGRGEGFGLVYLEAMRHGLACVAGMHDASGEVVEHGKTGFLVDQGNLEELARALLELLRNPGLRKQMGEAGLERVKTDFSFDRFRARLASVMTPFFSLEPGRA